VQHRIGHCIDADFRLDVWSSDGRWVANVEGFV
jgi:hypothetical protein